MISAMLIKQFFVTYTILHFVTFCYFCRIIRLNIIKMETVSQQPISAEKIVAPDYILNLSNNLTDGANINGAWQEIVMPTHEPSMSVGTDQDSVDASLEYVAECKKIKSELPTDKINVATTKQSLDILAKQINKSTEFSAMMSEYMFKGSAQVQDKVYQLFFNINKANEIMEYIHDYLALALESFYAKKAVKESGKDYTLEQLTTKLKAAE